MVGTADRAGRTIAPGTTAGTEGLTTTIGVGIPAKQPPGVLLAWPPLAPSTAW